VNFMNTTLDKDWIGDQNKAMKGFSWKSGIERHTTGINMWADAFLHTKEDGEKLAIFIMDTPGLFDNDSPTSDSLKIFALDALFSSTLIFNIQSQLKEYAIEYLQLTTNYAKYISESRGNELNRGKAIPFQNILFLVRDWNRFRQYPYGKIGGDAYVNETFRKNERNAKALLSVRENIYRTFENINGFLLPYPGEMAVSDKKSDGRWSRLDRRFQKPLIELLEYLCDSDNLKAKEVFGQKVTGRLYYEYVKTFGKIFQDDQFVPKTLYEATVKYQMQALLMELTNEYEKQIEEIDDLSNPNYLRDLDEAHVDIKRKVLDTFTDRPKVGAPAEFDEYKQKLSDEIEKIFGITRKKQAKKFINYKKLLEHTETQFADYKQKEEDLVEQLNHTLTDSAQKILDQQSQKETTEKIRKEQIDALIEEKRKIQADWVKAKLKIVNDNRVELRVLETVGIEKENCVQKHALSQKELFDKIVQVNGNKTAELQKEIQRLTTAITTAIIENGDKVFKLNEKLGQKLETNNKEFRDEKKIEIESKISDYKQKIEEQRAAVESNAADFEEARKEKIQFYDDETAKKMTLLTNSKEAEFSKLSKKYSDEMDNEISICTGKKDKLTNEKDAEYDAMVNEQNRLMFYIP
jgi:hypothetical protein